MKKRKKKRWLLTVTLRNNTGPQRRRGKNHSNARRPGTLRRGPAGLVPRPRRQRLFRGPRRRAAGQEHRLDKGQGNGNRRHQAHLRRARSCLDLADLFWSDGDAPLQRLMGFEPPTSIFFVRDQLGGDEIALSLLSSQCLLLRYGNYPRSLSVSRLSGVDGRCSLERDREWWKHS